MEIVQVPREYLGDLFRQAPTVALIIAQKLAERLLAASPITTEDSEPPAEAGFVDDPIDAPGTEPAEDSEPAERAEPPMEAAVPPRLPRNIDPLAIVPTLVGGQQAVGPKKPKSTVTMEAPPEHEKGKLSAFYPQAVQCPICTTKFEATRVRTKALKAIKRDSDFHSVYEGVNPVHYAVYVCPHCQYAAFDDSWSSLSEGARRRLEEDIDARRRSALEMEFTGERDFDTVMIAYLLALRCYDLREPDVRRRAGLLHRLAWIAREMENVELEQQYLALARSDYLKTFQQDSRITDEAAVTMSYLLGDLSLRLGQVDEAVNWFDKTLRMEQAQKHPGIVRMTRDRWADARSLTRQRSA